ncbi:Ig-like domain-containing protein [Ochrobactrum sp. C6C9]|uniref:Ig-like domain-containing protein n=1 Tax=Ochrobactrum sp. C6C9 TaxID=2736662 RepID=UPI0035300328|nr:Ig-like domain-containing protein [Ochrobactrum sp. C6C9]
MKKQEGNNNLKHIKSDYDSDDARVKSGLIDFHVRYEDNREMPLAKRKLIWQLVEGNAILSQSTTLTGDNGQSINAIKELPDNNIANAFVRLAVWPEDEPDIILAIEHILDAKKGSPRGEFDSLWLYPPAADQVLYDTAVPIRAAVAARLGRPYSNATLIWEYTINGEPAGDVLEYTKITTTDDHGNSNSSFYYKTTSGYPSEQVKIQVTVSTQGFSPELTQGPVDLTFVGGGHTNKLELSSPNGTEPLPTNTPKDIKLKLTDDKGYSLTNYFVDWGEPAAGAAYMDLQSTTDEHGETRATVKQTIEGIATFSVSVPKANITNAEFPINFCRQPSRLKIIPPTLDNIRYDDYVTIAAKALDGEGNPVPGVALHWKYEGYTNLGTGPQPDTDPDGIATTWFIVRTDYGYPHTPTKMTVTVSDDFGHTSEPVELDFVGGSLNNKLQLQNLSYGSTGNTDTPVEVILKLSTFEDIPLANYPIIWDIPTNGASILKHDPKTDPRGYANATLQGTRKGVADFRARVPLANATCQFPLNFRKQGSAPSSIALKLDPNEELRYDSKVLLEAVVLDSEENPVPNLTVLFEPHLDPMHNYEYRNEAVTNADGVAICWITLHTYSGYPSTPITLTMIAQTDDGSVKSNPVTGVFVGGGLHNKWKPIAPIDSPLHIGETTVVEFQLITPEGIGMGNYAISWDIPTNGGTVVTHETNTGASGKATASLTGKLTGTTEFTIRAPDANAFYTFSLDFHR